jgi:hypothetical protein
MSTSSSATWQHAVQVPSRRRLVRLLAGGALTGLAPIALSELAVAGKKRKKHQRRKKRKNGQQPDPQVRADATCPGPQMNGSLLPDGRVIAQSFTAVQSGLLVRADLEIQNIDNAPVPGTLFLRLAPLVDAFPGAGVLASAQVPASSVAQGIHVVSFAFAAPAPVQAGTSYALILSHDRSGGIAWSNRSGAACDGRSFVAFGGGAPFEPRENLDHLFTTFVEA